MSFDLKREILFEMRLNLFTTLTCVIREIYILKISNTFVSKKIIFIRTKSIHQFTEYYSVRNSSYPPLSKVAWIATFVVVSRPLSDLSVNGIFTTTFHGLFLKHGSKFASNLGIARKIRLGRQLHVPRAEYQWLVVYTGV